MRRTLTNALGATAFALIAFAIALPVAHADDLEDLGLPAFRDRAGFVLGITDYRLETDADLLEGDGPEHAFEFNALLQAPDDEDVLCFATTLRIESAQDSRGRNLLAPQRRRNTDNKFNPLVASSTYKNRRGEPLLLCPAELDSVGLSRPATEVDELVVVARAVVVKDRTSEQIRAEVADRFNDIGSGTSVRVTSIEIDRKSEMTVSLSVKHTGNRDLPVIDSIYALDRRGKTLGGGRWTSELELFAKRYELELAFPVQGDQRSVDQFRIVLATEYEVKDIAFRIEDVFSR